nr:MAG TPA: hypothetical protein [Caudoviricetes sp.]
MNISEHVTTVKVHQILFFLPCGKLVENSLVFCRTYLNKFCVHLYCSITCIPVSTLFWTFYFF